MRVVCDPTDIECNTPVKKKEKLSLLLSQSRRDDR